MQAEGQLGGVHQEGGRPVIGEADGLGGGRDRERALAIGGASPLPELFAAAGAKFEFTEASLGPLMAAIGRELDQLGP